MSKRSNPLFVVRCSLFGGTGRVHSAVRTNNQQPTTLRDPSLRQAQGRLSKTRRGDRLCATNNEQRTTNFFLLPATLAVFALASCGHPDSPGLEYFPDMYRSPSVEAYVDYGQDPYYFGDSLVEAQRMTQQARLPVPGTIAFSADASRAAYNFPYPYPNTTEGYDAAGLSLKSPLPMTQENVDKGKVIYVKMCLHCHGGSGAGDGPVVTIGGHAPPTAYNGPLKSLPEGKIFHTVTYGKGMMGSHAGQLNKEERWLVTRFVQYLQNDGKLTASATTAAGDSATMVKTRNVMPGGNEAPVEKSPTN